MIKNDQYNDQQKKGERTQREVYSKFSVISITFQSFLPRNFEDSCIHYAGPYPAETGGKTSIIIYHTRGKLKTLSQKPPLCSFALIALQVYVWMEK